MAVRPIVAIYKMTFQSVKFPENGIYCSKCLQFALTFSRRETGRNLDPKWQLETIKVGDSSVMCASVQKGEKLRN